MSLLPELYHLLAHASCTQTASTTEGHFLLLSSLYTACRYDSIQSLKRPPLQHHYAIDNSQFLATDCCQW